VVRSARIAVILLGAWLVQRFAGKLIGGLHRAVERRRPEFDLGRINTVNAVLRNVGTVLVVLVAGMLVLAELGVSVAPILATAGVAGIAIGFGAQSLIKDYFTGFFLLIEDQLREGDVVEIVGKGGLVEEVTLRYVRLRDADGHVHFVPNGEIKLVTNRTRGFATPVIDVGIAYREDPDAALQVMREVAKAMRADPQWRALITEDLEVIGLEQMAESALMLRVRLKVVPPIQQWNVKREYLKRVKKAFDEHGIEIPFPSFMLYSPPQPGQLAVPPDAIRGEKPRP
jgi:moderate conductance mechanosensitive channel